MDNSKVKMKILFYSPNSILIEHSFAENILIKELLKKGHQVNRILCDSVFDLCDSILSHVQSVSNFFFVYFFNSLERKQ